MTGHFVKKTAHSRSGKKACKTRKKGLQIHERTQTCAIEFADPFDVVSKNPDSFPPFLKGFSRLWALLTVRGIISY